MGGTALFVAVFLACLVEAVEATTIVLAAGITREWRSTLIGVACGLAALTVVTIVLGPAISVIPLAYLRAGVGGLLLVFGLQWLRKSILRASGYKALHDEAAIFATQVEAARSAGKHRRGAISDWYAFTLTFKAVLLEGLEVVFIVLTFGTNAHHVPLAAAAAGAAVAVVAGLGLVIRAPLSRIPENGMKFVVGVMLTSFGAFWAVEGVGGSWPAGDAVLLVLAPAIAAFGLLIIAWLRRRRLSGTATDSTAEAGMAS